MILNEEKLCFWLPTYPEILESFLIELISRNKYQIQIYCLSGILPERKDKYDGSSLKNFVSFWDGSMSLKEFFCANMKGKEKAIHIFGGLLGTVGQCLNWYQNIYTGRNALIFTEKPSVLPYASKVKTMMLIPLKRIKSFWVYRKAYYKNKKAILGILVTGQKGVKQLTSYGIPKDKIYNFMYTHIEENMASSINKCDDKIKFVYVGRFNYCNRGLDNLIYAFDHLEKTNWSLDLVGGYGENAKEIIEWSKKTPNVHYIGAWQSNEVIQNLQKYDVCVNPTRVDGWRIQVNQAIMAGIGTITTNEAISDELIAYSGAGAIVGASKKGELCSKVEYVINHPNMVSKWKENAIKYRDKISNQNVVDYFLSITEYLTNNKEDRPVCPWITNN